MTFDELALREIDRVFADLRDRAPVEAFARSGAQRVRLIFAHRRLADAFLPSFLPEEPGQPDLQISFVTSAETDLSRLIPHPADEYRTRATDACFAVWEPGELPLLNVMDRRSNRAIFWLAAGAAPDWIASRPTLPIMYAFSVPTPWLPLHAAAVGRNGRVLLLAGAGRAGKTTAALTCARAGWDYAGDDYVFAETTTGAIEPLYCSARMRADMATHFPEFADQAVGMARSDGDVRYELRFGGRLDPERLRGGSLSAILLPRRQGASQPEFAPARRMDAVSALYTSMTMTHLGWAEETIRKNVAMVGLAPVFFVDTGQDPALIPDAFAQFIDQL